MNAQHLETVINEFTSQATIWTGSVPSSLVELISGLELKPDDAVVDVAAGSCRVSRAIAPLVERVAAVEITEAMLDQGRQMAAQEGISNLEFHLGQAESLPFAVGQFDVAVTRYSFHHFVDAQAVMREMCRVTKPKGRVVVIDILAPDDGQLAHPYNHYQRLRDPSHTSALQLDGLRELFVAEGLEITHCHKSEASSELEGWLRLPALPDETKDQIRANVQTELNGGAATGLQPYLDSQTIRFRDRVVTIIGEKNVQHP